MSEETSAPVESHHEWSTRRRREAMVVSRFQARAALRLAGHLAEIEAVMDDPATDSLVVDAWADAQEFRRMSPTVLALADALGLTEADLDALFEQAARIEA